MAEAGLLEMLGSSRLDGKTFLDAGSGSGLFSLAARRLGAHVTSFDYDPTSVACTQKLKNTYFPNDSNWTVLTGSVLDSSFLASLGQFDIVYSWGVLHHTGEMWRGLNLVQTLLHDEGLMFIMIYEDMGWKSWLWKFVKRTYCSGSVGRACVLGTFIPYYVVRGLLEDLLQFRNPIRRYREYKKQRGMSKFRDWIDWLGGYPYEYARPADIMSFYQQKGLELVKCRAPEYVFSRPRAT